MERNYFNKLIILFLGMYPGEKFSLTNKAGVPLAPTPPAINEER